MNDNEDLMIINRSGIIIRMKVADLRVVGRATQGVKLIDLKDDIIAAVTRVPSEDDNDEEEYSDNEQQGEEIIENEN